MDDRSSTTTSENSAASEDEVEEIAEQLLAKHQDMPLKAFWEALRDPTLQGPAVPMAIINHPSCGLERRLTKEEGPMYSVSGHSTWQPALEYDATPIIIAAQAYRPDVVEALLEEGANSAEEANDRYTAVHAAALNGDAKSIALLVEYGADNGSYQATDMRTPLHAAAYKGHLEAVQALLATKAETEAYDKNGWTPMHLAAQCGHVGIIEALCEGGADVNASEVNGAYPLHFAAHNNHIDAIEFLIEKGAKVNATYAYGYTPLHLAAQYGHINAIKALLSHNADTEAQCPLGAEHMTPWQLAERMGFPEAVSLLK